jgi:hypothetical protein
LWIFTGAFGSQWAVVHQEYSMLMRVSRVLAIPALALSLTFGGFTLAGANENRLSPAVWELVATPIMKIVKEIEERVASLEASIAALAAKAPSESIASKQLCVADDTGAQTCISKAQLDALLRLQVATVEQQSATSVAVIASPAPAAVEPAAAEPAAAEPAKAPAAIAVSDEPEPAETGALASAAKAEVPAPVADE